MYVHTIVPLLIKGINICKFIGNNIIDYNPKNRHLYQTKNCGSKLGWYQNANLLYCFIFMVCSFRAIFVTKTNPTSFTVLCLLLGVGFFIGTITWWLYFHFVTELVQLMNTLIDFEPQFIRKIGKIYITSFLYFSTFLLKK